MHYTHTGRQIRNKFTEIRIKTSQLVLCLLRPGSGWYGWQLIGLFLYRDVYGGTLLSLHVKSMLQLFDMVECG